MPHCPHCQTVVADDPALVSCLVACPGCGQQFRMPVPQGAAFRTTSYAKRLPKPRRRPERLDPVWLAWGLAGGLLLIVLVVMLCGLAA